MHKNSYENEDINQLFSVSEYAHLWVTSALDNISFCPMTN